MEWLGPKRLAVGTLWLALVLRCGAADAALDYSSRYLRESLPCNLTTIHWVSVSTEESAEKLGIVASDYERLIRLRLKNDMSTIAQEVKGYDEVAEMPEDEMLKRGIVDCRVWTVGDDYPIAFNVECELSGWGRSFPYGKFEAEFLGFASKGRTKNSINESIREAIESIAADFYTTQTKLGIQ